VGLVAAGEHGHAQGDDEDGGDRSCEEPLLGCLLADAAPLLVEDDAGGTAVVAPDVDPERPEPLGGRAHRQDGGADDGQYPATDQ